MKRVEEFPKKVGSDLSVIGPQTGSEAPALIRHVVVTLDE